MRETAKRKPSSLLIKVLNVLTVLVLLAAIFSITKLVTELRRSFNREPYSNMEYNLQDENYGDMIREYYNRGYDVDPFPTVHEEEYRVAEYADAAFRHLFYDWTASRFIRPKARHNNREPHPEKNSARLLIESGRALCP